MSNFRLPHDARPSRTPASRRRAASASVCASASGQARERRPQQRVDALAAAPAALAQARVGEHHRHAARPAAARSRLGQISVSISTPTAGATWRRKRRTAPGVSNGSQAWRSPARSSACARGAAGRGAVGEQQAHAGPVRAQRLDQRRGGARLAERDRMHPERPRRHGSLVEAEALADRRSRRAARAGRASAGAASRAARAGAAATNSRRAQTRRGVALTRSAAATCARAAPAPLPGRPDRVDGRRRLAFDRDLLAARRGAAAARCATRSGSCRSARAAGRARRRCGSGPLSTPIAPWHAGEPVDERAELHRRPDRRCAAADRRGDRFARAPSAPPACGSATRPACVDEAAAELDPVRFGPELVVARRAVDEDHVARAARAAPARSAQAERRRRVDARSRAPRATSSRARSSAWLCGSTRIACVDQQARRPLVARAVGAVGQADSSPAARQRARSAPTWSGPAGRSTAS